MGCELRSRICLLGGESDPRYYDPMTVTQLLRDIWRNAPLACAFWVVFCLVHLECRTLYPPAWGLVYTAVFPLIWLGWAVWRESAKARLERRSCVRRVLLTCVVLPLATASIPGVHFLRAYESLKLAYEFASLLLFGVMAIHCLRQRGVWVFALFFVAGAIYGMALENGGIEMGFFSEEGYRLYLRPFLPGPLVTALGWCTVLYMVTFITERITDTATPVWLRTALAVGIALSMDLQIDPVAARVGWWVWHPSLPRAHHGVPLINYISWACAIAPFAWHYFSMVSREHGDCGRAIRTFAGIPVYLVVGGILVMSATFVLCGPKSASMRLFLNALS